MPDSARPPFRFVPCSLSDLVGKRVSEVLALIGKPNGEYPGDVWYSPQEMSMVRRAKQGGGWEKTVFFGLRASNIPLGRPYRIWEYQHVVREGTVLPDDSPAAREAALTAARARGGPLPPPMSDPSSRWNLYIGVASDGASPAPDDLVIEARGAGTSAVF